MKPFEVNFLALALTSEEEQLALHFFGKILDLVSQDEKAAGPQTGLALCVALVQFLGIGMRAGLLSGDLSKERAQSFVDSLSMLLTKAS